MIGFLRQIAITVVVAASALLVWVNYVPSAVPYLDRAGVLPVLRGVDAAVPVRLLPPEGEARSGGGGPGGGFGPRGPAPVVTVEVGSGTMNDLVTAIGDGRALRAVTVVPDGSWRITTLAVDSGEEVDEGDLIAELDSDAEVIALERAKLTRDDALERVDRQQRLFDSGTTSDVALRDAELALRTAELAVRAAEYDLDARRILAPIAGSVGLLAVDEGDTVTAQTELARIEDRSRILVDFRVPERLVGRIAPGAPLRVEPLAQPGDRYAGRVRALDNRVDQTSRTLLVQAELDNPGNDLRSGMAFRITIDLPGEVYPSVDPLSVQWNDDGAFVWVVRDGQAAQVAVRVMQRTAEAVLVRGELTPGEPLIIEGVQTLRPGAEVAPQAPPPSAGARQRDGGDRRDGDAAPDAARDTARAPGSAT